MSQRINSCSESFCYYLNLVGSEDKSRYQILTLPALGICPYLMGRELHGSSSLVLAGTPV